MEIRLAKEAPNADGVVYVSSPDVPLFHVDVRPGEDFDEVVMPVLEATLERRGVSVDGIRVSHVAAEGWGG